MDLILVTLGALAGFAPPRALAPLGITAAAQLPLPAPASLTESLRLDSALRRRDTGSRVLLGGLIGAAAGVVVCTVISNIVKDPGTGFSTCTTKGYVGFASGGFAVGALVGLATR